MVVRIIEIGYFLFTQMKYKGNDVISILTIDRSIFEYPITPL